MSTRALLLLILLPLFGACASDGPTDPGSTAERLPLDMPSDAESLFAEGRDFTVVGYFDPPLARPGDVRVELFAGSRAFGRPIRVVQSHVDPVTGRTPRSALDLSYARGRSWGPLGETQDPVDIVMTPDLVAVPGGFDDPKNKVVVTSEYYAAVILGGATEDFDTSYESADGTRLPHLSSGSYTLRVTGMSGELQGRVATRQIGFGETDAMLGRFSPPEHKAILLAEAASAGLRTYTDFFPGFFAHRGYSYEIPGRWMPNNSVEVVNALGFARVDGPSVARNRVFLYNVPAESATNRIEIGAIVTHGLIDSDRTGFSYYSLGEPSLEFESWSDGGSVTVRSTVETLAPGDRLQITRLEIEPAGRPADEGEYRAYETRTFDLVTDLSRRPVLEAGEMFTILGLVTPIPSSTTAGAGSGQYVMDNTIASITYTVVHKSTGLAVAVGDRRGVGLVRHYSPSTASDDVPASIYEFEHEFAPTQLEWGGGSYLVTMQGLDRDEAPVAGAVETFEFVLRPAAAR